MSKGSTRSVMSHSFSHAPQANIPRSLFKRPHGYKCTFDAGKLVPVFVDEVLPGDTFNLKMNVFARIATLKTPLMDNLFLDSFFFFVPNRLVWDNWQKFCGEQKNPGDSTDYLIPQIPAPASTGWAVGTLGDYFGIPIQKTGFSVNSLHFRAYNLIWNEWFRDENLQNSVVVDLDDGPDAPADYVLLNRCKRYDYFTSCLPWPQKGDAVTIPIGTSAPVVTNNVVPNFTGGSATNQNLLWNSAQNGLSLAASAGAGNPTLKFGTNTGLQADLSAATPISINELREAFQIQKMLERDARGGTRYIEVIKSHFGVTSPDARLQRPELLGMGSSPVNIMSVPQTSAAASQPTPQATLTAYGTISGGRHGFVKSFVEHGVIIGMICVRADLNYQQGLNRMWSRRGRYDVYWPALSHIGEQAVLNKEIFLQATSADDQVFGYQERFAEYRYKPSLVTGQFRSDFAQTLDIWHLSQDFASLPVLNSSFIQENPPIDRVKALTDTYPDFLLDAYFDLKTARPMPTYSVPGLVDHF